MHLSTTINFFILTNDGNIDTYKEHIRRYHSLGYTRLDAIFAGADGKDSPIMADDYLYFAQEMRKEADRLGIRFAQGHLPYYENFVKNEPDPRRDESVRRTIECFGIMGVEWAVSHPGAVMRVSDAVAKSKEACIRYFTPLIESSLKHGVGFCIENLFDYGGGRRYCAIAEELIDLVDSFGDKNVGVCWDFGHGNLVYDDMTEPLKMIGNRLKMTHVHDNNGHGDQHLAPFFGNINWHEMVHVLREIGYDKCFSFEVVNKSFKHAIELGMSEWAHVRAVGERLLQMEGSH